MMLLALAFCSSVFAADPPSTETEVMGYSPELNAVFAQVFRVPDDGKCKGYILDFEKKIRFIVPPQPDIAKSVVALGEDDERSSCQLRAFDAQLELKLKTTKTFTPEEKAKYDQYYKTEWSKPVAGFKDKPIASLGVWLKSQRPSYQPGLADKVYQLGTEEAADGNWLDSYDALVIATELQPFMATKDSREAAKKASDKAAKETGAKALIIWDIVNKLDPRAARPMLKLAGSGIGADRAFHFIEKALKIDPVLTTRMYREDADFKDLRCSPRHAAARKKLPPSLTQDASC
jgi:hypothetical protein